MYMKYTNYYFVLPMYLFISITLEDAIFYLDKRFTIVILRFHFQHILLTDIHLCDIDTSLKMMSCVIPCGWYTIHNLRHI